MPVEVLSLALLDAAPADSVRASRDQTVIDDYAAAMQGGAVFPALQVYRDEKGQLWVWDGGYRLAAARKLELDEIRCDVEPGEKGDAFARARREGNVLHGVRRSNADKQKIGRDIVSEELDRRAAGQKETSSRELGALAGGTREKPELSHTFINRLIKELTAERAKAAAEKAEEEGWRATIQACIGPARALGFAMVATSYDTLDLSLEPEALLATLPRKWNLQAAAEKLALIGARDPRRQPRQHDVFRLSDDVSAYTAIIVEGNSYRWTVHHLGSDQRSFTSSEWAALLERVNVEVIQQAIPRPPANLRDDPVWAPPPEGLDWIALHPFQPTPAATASQERAPATPPAAPTPSGLLYPYAPKLAFSVEDEPKVKHLGARPIGECLADLAALLPACDLRSSLSHDGGVVLESVDGAHEFVVVVEHRDDDEGGSRATEMERYLGELLVLLSQGGAVVADVDAHTTTGMSANVAKVEKCEGCPSPAVTHDEMGVPLCEACDAVCMEDIPAPVAAPLVDREALLDRLQDRRAGRPLTNIGGWLRDAIDRIDTMEEAEAVTLVGFLDQRDAEERAERAELRERIQHLATHGHARTLTPVLAYTTPRLSLGALASRVQDAWEMAYPEPEDHPHHEEPSCPDPSPPAASPASPSAEKAPGAPPATAADYADSATAGAGPTCNGAGPTSPPSASPAASGDAATTCPTSAATASSSSTAKSPGETTSTTAETSATMGTTTVPSRTATDPAGTTSTVATPTTEPAQLNPADFWACGTCGRITERGDDSQHVALHGIICPQVQPFADLDLSNPMEVQRWRIFCREYAAQYVTCAACNGVARLRPDGSIPPHTRPRREDEKGRRKLVPCEGAGTVPGSIEAAPAAPALPKPPSKGATKATSLLFGLRDLGVELFTYTDEDGEIDEQTISTWLSDVLTMAAPRLKHLTAALEVALASAKMSAEDRQRAASAAQEPARPPASERRAEGRECGQRIGRCINRMRALRDQGEAEIRLAAGPMDLPAVVRALQQKSLTDELLAEIEAVLFPPELEPAPQYEPVRPPTARERMAWPDPAGNLVVSDPEDWAAEVEEADATSEQQALPMAPPDTVEQLRQRLEDLLQREVTSLPFQGRPALPIRAILFNLETFTADQRAELAQKVDAATRAADPMGIYKPWRGTADDLAVQLEALNDDERERVRQAFGVAPGARLVERLTNRIRRGA